MGEVAIRYKIMCHPDSDISADDLAESIAAIEIEIGVVQSVETKPLAFGMKFIDAYCVIQEGDGTVDMFEDAIKSIEGVGELEVLEIGRLM
tara:strand:- start:189 stop:461 length:273 start_codon:yes stop_codon:yes gene_type:complete